MNTDQVFDFESELERNLTFIPMAVRFKLDQCGIKLSLSQWTRMPEERRRELLSTRCEGEAGVARFRARLAATISEFSGDDPTATAPVWKPADIPQQIVDKLTQLGRPPSLAEWQALTELQRFTLAKLARGTGEHRNLLPALREFGLLSPMMESTRACPG